MQRLRRLQEVHVGVGKILLLFRNTGILRLKKKYFGIIVSLHVISLPNVMVWLPGSPEISPWGQDSHEKMISL